VSQLVAFAEHEFRLNKRGKDGTSLRETLQVVERMTGRMPAEGINPVEFPETALHVWNWFQQLSAGRGGGGMGPSAITYPDMQAFFGLYGIRPDVWELDAIRLLDGVALNSANTQ
jgi:hypothetical protein